MIATFIGFSIRLWIAPSDPDTDVHTSGGAYPDVGEFFMNTSNGNLFICSAFIPPQIWTSTTNASLIQAMIAMIPQADWNESNNMLSDYIKNKPTIPAAQVNSDWSSSSGVSQILNKPSLSTVATSGSYNDLSSKPTIPSAQVNSDWSSVSGLAQILNKPSLSTVATSGAYTDLTGKPSLSTVATSGAYTDLSGKPTIPSAQIQSDWTQTSTGSVDYIKNKPVARSQSSTTRSLNTGFQVSTTRDSLVNYAVNVTTTASLTSGQTGTVAIDIASDSGFTTNLQSLSAVNGNSVSLAIALTAVQTVTATLSYYVPAAYYVRLRTVNTLGTPTFSYAGGQEILL